MAAPKLVIVHELFNEACKDIVIDPARDVVGDFLADLHLKDDNKFGV